MVFCCAGMVFSFYMIMSKSPYVKVLAGVAVLVLVIGLGVLGWQYQKSHSVPAFPISKADTISSWSFKGAYTGNDTLVAQANADIAHLTGLLGKGEYDDYDLYNGMGNDDLLLGDGSGAYAAYNKSISIHPDKGLAYTNMGHLMDVLGAYETAAAAYAKAVAVEPGQLQYHLMRLDFLTKRLPTDKDKILAAFTDASNQFGDTAPVLMIEAEWLTDQGRYADAITAWERAKLLSPGKDMTAVDKAISRLEAKQAAAQ